MPEIARFYGLVIKMFLMNREHNQPHFYALYGEFYIATLTMMEGDLPPRAVNLVREWARVHQQELMSMWDTQKLHKLPPLK